MDQYQNSLQNKNINVPSGGGRYMSSFMTKAAASVDSTIKNYTSWIYVILVWYLSQYFNMRTITHILRINLELENKNLQVNVRFGAKRHWPTVGRSSDNVKLRVWYCRKIMWTLRSANNFMLFDVADIK